jgi:hypothetical protein
MMVNNVGSTEMLRVAWALADCDWQIAVHVKGNGLHIQ